MNAPDLDPYLMFRSVSYYLGAFGTVCCVTTLSSKRAKLVQKFMPQSRVGIFRNERTRWYETHQNMSLGSNGVDRVRFREKFQFGFVAQTFALVRPVLHRIL